MGYLEDAAAVLSSVALLVRDDALGAVGNDLREALRLLSVAGGAAYTNWSPKIERFIENLDELQAEMGAVRSELDQVSGSVARGEGFGTGEA